MKPVIRTRFDESLTLSGHGLSCPLDEGKTSSEFAKDCDINSIMARYEKTGQLPQYSRGAAQYGDFSQIPDFATMRHRVIAAEEMFMALPAKVRAVFGNDPGAFIAAADSQEGIALLKSLGLGNPDNAPLNVSNVLPGAAAPSSAGQADPSANLPPADLAAVQQKTKKGN